MATFKMQSGTFTVNGNEYDMCDAVMNYSASEASEPIAIPKLVGVTVTMSFGVATRVGFGRRYGLRELHLNLARYTTWPYTN